MFKTRCLRTLLLSLATNENYARVEARRWKLAFDVLGHEEVVGASVWLLPLDSTTTGVGAGSLRALVNKPFFIIRSLGMDRCLFRFLVETRLVR